MVDHIPTAIHSAFVAAAVLAVCEKAKAAVPAGAPDSKANAAKKLMAMVTAVSTPHAAQATTFPVGYWSPDTQSAKTKAPAITDAVTMMTVYSVLA